MKSMLGIGAVVALTGTAMAVTPFTEDFSYPDGSLVPNGGWVSHSGTTGQVQVSSGAISLVQGSQSEDVSRSFGSPLGAGETVFFGFDVTMSGSGPATDTYFAHVKNSGTFFSSRIFVSSPNAGGDYSYGFSASSTIAGEWSTDFSYGSTQRVIASYDFDTGAINLWINASSMGDPSLSFFGFAGDAMEFIAFREAAGNTVQVIDNVAVGSTFAEVVPTPGAAALMGIAGLASVRRRRTA